MKTLTAAKAKKILKDRMIRGKRITAKQVRFFWARVHGLPLKKRRKNRKAKKK